MSESAARSFERQFLAWVQIRFGVQPEGHAGTNAYWWSVPFGGAQVDFVIVGPDMNGMMPGNAGDWILRVEEPADAGFVAEVESHFAPGAGLRRRKARERVRVQFKQVDLVQPFDDQTTGTGPPDAADRIAAAGESGFPIHDDLVMLLRSELPDVEKRHAAGNLRPCGGFMSPDGYLFDDMSVDRGDAPADIEQAMNRLTLKYRDDLREGRVRAAAVIAHAHFDGSRLRYTAHAHEANALVAFLEHIQGGAVQAILRYRQDGGPQSPPRGSAYEWPPDFHQISGLVFLWCFETIWSVPALHPNPGAIVHVAIDAASGAALAAHANGSAALLDLRDGARLKEVPLPPRGAGASASALSARRWLDGDGDGCLVLHDLSSDTVIRRVDTGASPIVSCALDPLGRVAIAGGQTGEVVCCDLGWSECHDLWTGVPSAIEACAWSGDSQRAATVSATGVVTMWNIAQGKGERLAQFRETVPGARWLSMSHDGRYALVAGDWMCALCDFDRVSVGPLTDSGGPIACCALSPSGRFALFGLRTNRIRLWDMLHGRPIVEFDTVDRPTRVAFMPDNGSAIVGYESGAVMRVRLLSL